MRITDTLDQLLRLLLATDDERPSDAAPSATAQKPAEPDRTNTVSVGAGLPITGSVHAWNTNDVPAHAEDVTPTLRAPEPRVAPVEAAPVEPEERELPEWVRRVQAHRVDEVSDELVPEDRVEPSGAVSVESDVPEPVAVEFAVEAPVAEPEPVAEPVVEASGEVEQEADDAEAKMLAAAETEAEVALPVARESVTPDEDAAVGTAAHLVPAVPDIARLEATAQVVESMSLGFHLGSAVERIAAAADRGSEGVGALREATWLIERYIALIERRPIGADIHLSSRRLARTGDVIADIRAALDSVERERPTTGGDDPDPSSPGRIRRLSP